MLGVTFNVFTRLVRRLTARFAIIQLQEGGKHDIRHKDAFRGGEFNLIWSHAKIDVRTISGRFFFLPICLLVNMKNVKFVGLQVHYLSHTTK